jgi:hypothetical protein
VDRLVIPDHRRKDGPGLEGWGTWSHSGPSGTALRRQAKFEGDAHERHPYARRAQMRGGSEFPRGLDKVRVGSAAC